MSKRIAWNKGIRHSKETIEKMKIARAGNKPSLGKRWKVKDTSKYSEAQIGSKNHRWGKKDSLITRKKKSEARLGSKNPMWKGGVNELNDTIRKSLKYKIWKESVFKRDNYTCQKCGKRGGELHADHIKQFAFYKKLRFRISNGRTLCKKCHKKTKTYGNNKKDKVRT